MEAPARVAQQTFLQPTNQPTIPGIAKHIGLIHKHIVKHEAARLPPKAILLLVCLIPV